MLGRIKSQTPYPPSPNATEIAQLPEILPHHIYSDLRVFSLGLLPTDKTIKSFAHQLPCWVSFKGLFLQDLVIYHIPHATFAWNFPLKFNWNQVMLALLLKHWRYAKEHGAFADYSIDPGHVGEAVVRAVIERWIQGREKESSRSRIQKKCVERQNTVSRIQSTPDLLMF